MKRLLENTLSHINFLYIIDLKGNLYESHGYRLSLQLNTRTHKGAGTRPQVLVTMGASVWR